MTLATHIVIARAVGKKLAIANPLAGFLVGWASHYLADLIPHWDYRLASLTYRDPETKKEKMRARGALGDYLKVGLDAFLGFAVAVAFSYPQNWSEWLTLGAIAFGAVFPDFLQFLYYITGNWKILKYFQSFQEFMHTKIKLGRKPLIGIAFQAIIFLLAVFFILH